MYTTAFLTGALCVAVASSAPFNHAGNTKSSGNYAVSHEGRFTGKVVDNADDPAASRAQYITAIKSSRSAPT